MKRISLLLTGIIVTLVSFGSVITDPLTLQGIIQNGILNAPFIFEGEVVATKSYWNPEHDYIYTSNTVKLVNVWKNNQNEVTYFEQGQLVEVITHGGTVNDTTLSITHNIGFVPGQTGMFLCNNAVVPINPNTEISTSLQFELFDGLFLEYDYKDLNISVTYGTIHFECIEELYELINPTYAAECLGVYPNGVLQKEKYDEIIELQETTYQSALNSSAYGEISYLMRNAKSIQNNGKSVLSIEIWAQTDIQGVYLTTSHVSLEFNTAAFGSTPVGNSRVAIFKGGFIYGNYNGAQRYIIPGSADLASNSSGYGVIGFGTHVNGSTIDPIEMLQHTPVHLFTVQIEIQNCLELPELSFTNKSNMKTYSGYVSLMPPGYPYKWSGDQNFAKIDAADEENQPMCETVISLISPSNTQSPYKVNAGNTDVIGSSAFPVVTNGDLVTVVGQFFGSVKGTIKMRNSDYTDIDIYVSLDSDVDIISWTDTKIVFRVPSTLPINYGNVTSLLKVPGSGKIKVITKATSTSISNEVLSNHKVIVGYSRRNINRDSPLPGYKNKLYLTGPNQVLDEDGVNSHSGFLFYVDPNLTALNTKALPCVQEALNGWVCATEVRFGLSNTTLSPFPSKANDNLSTIRIGPAISSTGSRVLAFTEAWLTSCTDYLSLLPIEYTYEMDIVFTNDPAIVNDYWFDETRYLDQPANLYDFYSIAMHEFGHAVLLNHVNQFDDIMRSGTQRATYAFHHWHRKINLTSDDILGGSTIVQESSGIHLSNCQGGAPVDLMIPLILSNCNLPTSVNEQKGIEVDSKVVVAPNPFRNRVEVAFTLNESSKVSYVVYSVEGKVVYQSSILQLGSGKQELYWESEQIQKGIYIMDLLINDQLQRVKLVKL